MSLLVTSLLISIAAADGTRFALTPVTSGLLELPYRPRQITVSAYRPSRIQKLPPGLVRPSYGVIEVGPSGKGRVYPFVIDEGAPEGASFYLDRNGNGDLTDDGVDKTKHKTFMSSRGQIWSHVQQTQLLVPSGGRVIPVGVNISLWSKTLEEAKNKISVAFEGGYRGKVRLNGKSYEATVFDGTMSGDYTAAGDEKSWVELKIDVNGNGRIDDRGEKFQLGKPLNIAGTTYEIRARTWDGSEFEVVPSGQTVAEVPPPDVLRVGETVKPFEVKTLEGKTVKFPEDFRGKTVLLDFCASWRDACTEAAPVLQKVRKSLASQGLEILSIAVEVPKESENPLKPVKDPVADAQSLVKAGVDWPIALADKGWKSSIVDRYGLDWTPTRVLVDGSTGKILVGPEALQNQTLVQEIYRTLKATAPSGQRDALAVKVPADVKDRKLFLEVVRRVEIDQASRQHMAGDLDTPAGNRRFREIDHDNTAWVKALLRRAGWPGHRLIGKDGSHYVWLMLQHADDDKEFQEYALDVLKKAVDQNDASAKDWAYLVDRVRTGEGKPQVYGTQFTFDGKKWVPMTIEDEANVDARRKSVGMGPIADVAKRLNGG